MEILLLIGRDLGEAHHVLEQRIGPPHSPYAQKIGFGWVVIADVCLGRTHIPDTVIANKVTVLPNGRPTLCDLCPNNIVVKENLPSRKHNDEYLPCVSETDSIGDSVFQTTDSDDQPGLSVEDLSLIHISEPTRPLYISYAVFCLKKRPRVW